MIKCIFKISFVFLILTSCKKDFGGQVNPLVESFKMPKDESKNIIFKHNDVLHLIGYKDARYSEPFDPYNVYSFDIEKGSFKSIEKRIIPDLEDWRENENKIMLAASCNNEVYVLTESKELFKLKSDFSYNEQDLVNRFNNAVSFFSFNNLIFISQTDGKLIVYDPITGLTSETALEGNPISQIIKKDNFFYFASGKSIYKSVDCKSWDIHFTINSNSYDQLLNINFHNGSFICASKSGEKIYTLKLDFFTGGNIVTFTDPFDFSKTSSYSDSNDDYNYDYDYNSYTAMGLTGYSYIIGNYYFSFVDEFGDSYSSDYVKKTRPTFPLVSENISTTKTKIADGSVFNSELRYSKYNNLNVIQIENYLFYLDNLYEESETSYTNRSRLKKVTIPNN